MIEKYIQFAIDNGFNFGPFFYIKKYKHINKEDLWNHIHYTYTVNGIDLMQIITSKPFIEAVVKGILYQTFGDESGGDDYFEAKMQSITREQAYAIRDSKLEEFITNLLLGKKQ